MSPRAATLMGLALGALCACAASGPRAPADPARVRAFAALPDWTGLWETEAAHSLIETGRMMRPALWGKPPYNAEWTQRQADTGAGGTRPGPIDLPADAKICAPGGFPTAMDVPVADYQLNYLLTPEQVVIVTNDGTVRHIHTDGRGHPSDVWPTADGHSIGRWEGDTLVVDTIARKAGPVGPVPEAAVLGENARFTELIRRLDDERMQIELTIEDPERLAQPWNLLLRYRRVHDLDRIIYLDCRENDRNPFVDGQFIIAPPR